jgi:hypothetical protein
MTRAEVLATLGRAIESVHRAAGDCDCGLTRHACVCRHRHPDAKLLATLRHAIRTGRVTLPKPNTNHE